MDARQLTPRYSVSPQITPADVPDIVRAGFGTVICNRPDAEVTEDICSARMRAAVEAAGLEFIVLELTHQTMTAENVARQKDMIASATGPVLAYCASGTRCSVIWALGQAAEIDADTILSAARSAGYELGHLRPVLDSIAAAQG